MIESIKFISLNEFKDLESTSHIRLSLTQEPRFLKSSEQHFHDNLSLYEMFDLQSPQYQAGYLKIKTLEQSFFLPTLKLTQHSSFSYFIPNKKFENALFSMEHSPLPSLPLLILELNQKLEYNLHCRQSLLGFDLTRSMFDFFSHYSEEERSQMASRSPKIEIIEGNLQYDLDDFNSFYTEHIRKKVSASFTLKRTHNILIEEYGSNFKLYRIIWNGKTRAYVSGILLEKDFWLLDFIGRDDFQSSHNYATALICFNHFLKMNGIDRIKTTIFEWILEPIFKLMNLKQTSSETKNMERWRQRGLIELNE